MMADEFLVRAVQPADYGEWRQLWDAYNRFYGRHGISALAENITAATWKLFFLPQERVHALVAVERGQIIGIAHYLFHRSTSRLNEVCYPKTCLQSKSCEVEASADDSLTLCTRPPALPAAAVCTGKRR
jgi:hypothetical protein